MNKNCKHCHTCGHALNMVLDGEEWCPNCGEYRRYRSHGWNLAVAENIPCPDYRTVTIPARDEHDGIDAARITLRWNCPVCRGPRGDIIHNVRSYDGSRILYCDGWSNPCGHVDKYSEVLQEAARAGRPEDHTDRPEFPIYHDAHGREHAEY